MGKFCGPAPIRRAGRPLRRRADCGRRPASCRYSCALTLMSASLYSPRARKEVVMGERLKNVAVAVLGAALLASFGDRAQAQASGATPPSRRASIDSAEQLASARGVVQRGAVLAQRLNTMLDEARREADIIRVTCLNDKLTQTNANMRTAQARLAAFESAADTDQKTHEATVLNVLGQKFQLLDQEASRCVGQDLYETGSTRVLTEIDTAQLPFEEDVAQPPPPPPPIVPILPLAASGLGDGL